MHSLYLLVVISATASMAGAILLPPEVTNQIRMNFRQNLGQMFNMGNRQTVIPIPVPVQTQQQQQFVEYVEYIIVEDGPQFTQYYPWNPNQIPQQEYIVIENGMQYLFRPGFGYQVIGPVNGAQQQEYIVVENGMQFLIRPGMQPQPLGPVNGAQQQEYIVVQNGIQYLIRPGVTPQPIGQVNGRSAQTQQQTFQQQIFQQMPQQFQNVPFIGIRTLEDGKIQVLGLKEEMALELLQRNDIIRNNNAKIMTSDIATPQPQKKQPAARVAIKQVARR